jgi:phage gpG-like protein
LARVEERGLMAETTIRVIGYNEASERIRATARGISKEKFDGVRKATLIMERAVKRELTGGALNVGRGMLRRSFTSGTFAVGDDVQGVVGSPARYAAIHETGGEIRPKGRALAIPLHPSAKYAKPRDFSDLFIVKTAGKIFLARNAGGKRSSRVDFMYLLVPRVRMPARRYLTKAQESSQSEVVAAVGGQIASAIARPQ